jgi:hypothetical protein
VTPPECKVCGGVEQDPELHRAVLGVRSWVRECLRRVLEPVALPAPRSKPFASNMASITTLRCPASREKEKRVRNKNDQR